MNRKKTTKSCFCRSRSRAHTLSCLCTPIWLRLSRHHQQNTIYETILLLLITEHTPICIWLLFSTTQILANERTHSDFALVSICAHFGQPLFPRTCAHSISCTELDAKIHPNPFRFPFEFLRKLALVNRSLGNQIALLIAITFGSNWCYAHGLLARMRVCVCALCVRAQSKRQLIFCVRVAESALCLCHSANFSIVGMSKHRLQQCYTHSGWFTMQRVTCYAAASPSIHGLNRNFLDKIVIFAPIQRW